MGFFTRLNALVDDVLDSNKLEKQEKREVLYELLLCVHAAGSLETISELAHRNVTGHTGEFYQLTSEGFKATVGNRKVFRWVKNDAERSVQEFRGRINQLLKGTDITWEGSPDEAEAEQQTRKKTKVS